MKSPLVLLHGFAGHADAWGEIVAKSASHVVVPNVYGHDPDDVPTAPTTFIDEVDRLAAMLRRIGAPLRIGGYSMGGRLALGIARRHRDLVESMVLIGASPGLRTRAEQDERKRDDERWARRIEDEGVPAFASAWQAQPLFVSQQRLPEEVLERQRTIRLRHSPRGLALAMRSLGLGGMPNCWDDLATFDLPVDVVVGGLDAKFLDLGRAMGRSLPRCTLHVVDDVGHNVVLEEPAAVAEILYGARGSLSASCRA